MCISIPKEVKLAVENAGKEKQRDQWYEIVRKMVFGKQAVGRQIAGLPEEIAEMISNNSKEIKVMPVRDNSDNKTDYYAIFNLCEIEGRDWSDYITMEVPPGKARFFSGANKWHLKEWVRTSWLRKLGVRKVQLNEAGQ